MKKLPKIILCFYLCLFTNTVWAQSLNEDAFTLLDLNYPGLEEVNRLYNEGNKEDAAKALLKYYQNRKSIINPTINLDSITISKQEQEWADEALKHTFYVHDGYRPFNYGKDINWQYWPVKDNELRWQLHRHKWFIPMGKAYYLSKDEKYAKEWVYQYRDWVRKNPLLEIDAQEYEILSHSKTKDVAENVRFAWRPLETSHRLADQINQFTLFLSSPSFTADFLTEFLVNYRRHAFHVLHNYSAEGNHLLFEAQRMIYAGVFFPEFKEAVSWRESGIKILNREIEKQVYEDGGQYELDLGYHAACIDIFQKALFMAESNGFHNEFPQSYIKTVENMIVFFLNLNFPDYTYPCFSDASRNNTWDRFRNWAKLFPDNKQIRYFATLGKEGKAPDNLSKGFLTSGFFTFRNGWNKDATIMMIKAGPKGEWHCQPDNGTFELWFNGKNLFPDSGSYVYGGDKEVAKLRNWFRQTAVHNTLTLNNKDLETTQSVTKQWKTDGDIQVLVTENPSYKELKHRRFIFFIDASYFVIVDEAIGTAQGTINLHYQLCDGKVNVDSQNKKLATAYEGNSNVVLQCFTNKEVKMEEEEGWYSTSYRHRTKRPAFAFNVEKTSEETVSYITVIYPVKDINKKVDISAKFQEKTRNSVELEVKINGKKQTLKCQLQE